MKQSGLLQRQREREDAALAAGIRIGVQYAIDTLTLVSTRPTDGAMTGRCGSWRSGGPTGSFTNQPWTFGMQRQMSTVTSWTRA